MKCISYIRFSSPEQAKGRSRERQLESAQEFARKQGWELDESLCMFDPAMSGFHREHISKGELGVFLEGVKAGKIPTPCALLVENLDRLSRDKIPIALKQFLEIIEGGITVVTLMDEQIYDSESIANGMQQLLISVSIMSRAHEESLTKQIRRTDNWQKGRESARTKGKKIPARCAAWLKLSEDKSRFEPIEEKVEIVRQIYEKYLQGHGLVGICRILNREKIKPFQGRGSWGTTTVKRLLTTRTVLGEMQFLKTARVINGKRIMVPDGEPIYNYYPRIIDDNIFYSVQKRMELRKCAFGKIGEMNNLFSGLVKCGYCGATMQYSTRGRKKHKYLNCRESVKGNCEYMSFRYQDFEDAFLMQCKKLKLTDIIRDDISEHEKRVKILKDELLVTRSMTKLSEQKVDNFTNALGSGGSPATIRHLVGLIDNEKIEQSKYLIKENDLLKEIHQLNNLYHNTKVSLNDIQDAFKQISTSSREERENIRRLLQKEIRALVERIDIYPHGRYYFQCKELLKRSDMPDDLRQHFENITGKDAKKYRSCTVRFRGGGIIAFIHNCDTNELQWSVEIDENDKFNQDTHDKFDQFFRRVEWRDNIEIEKKLIKLISSETK